MPSFPSLIPPETVQPEQGAKQRILVVDDSKLQRKILSSSLMRWGYEVIEADCGDTALQILFGTQA